MRCRFVKEIFHNKDNGFCIFVYHTEDTDVPEAAKTPVIKEKAPGSRQRATACRIRRPRKRSLRGTG